MGALARVVQPHTIVLRVRPCRSMDRDRPSRWGPCRVSRQRRPACAASCSSKSVEAEERRPPWAFGFQTNERLLRWDDSAQLRLLMLHATQELHLDPELVEARVSELQRLLPDLMAKLQRMRANLFLQLLQDQDIAGKLIRLRELLPGVNVSVVVARCPALLLERDAAMLGTALGRLRQQLPGVDVTALVEREPGLLLADVGALLAEVRRLMPSADPVQYLARNPHSVLDMQQAGLPSTMDLPVDP
ncbi:hypothetical protein WJX72_009990 [[Myrmecia] bisecta]|uniref:Uncharacterized protein n=1 Tax=[Myrmecia] bisecta TaxID=41462 RepID=A0AAW1QAS8_9CHLO